MKDLPIEHKFDVIVADPPYNIGKDFGNNSDNMPMTEYLDWTHKWLSRCFELLADNGIIYVYGFPEILARVAANYPIDAQRWLVWHYTNKAVPSSKFWQRSHESILCLWNPASKRPDLEIDQIREPYTESYKNVIGKVRAGTDSRFSDSGKETIYQDHGGALPRDVIKIPALAGGAGGAERWFMCKNCGNKVYPPSEINKHRQHELMKHPTQKPMELTRRLIQSRINGNSGRTLIPFAGSGSECVAAASLGVEWLGIELNAEYVDFAKKWIRQANV
jgi:site-specific DNA-methyltransferase (adenine-specific)